MARNTLVDTATLAEHLGDDDWVTVDCRYDLADHEAGRQQYLAGHVPGAFHADLGRHLAAAPRTSGGRHPLPDPATLSAWLGSIGVGPATQVVVYDAGPGMFAARLWWLLRWLGHESVALLDGGFDAWTAEGRAVSLPIPEPVPARFVPHPGCLPTVDAQALHSQPDAYLIVDARAAERFRGETEPMDPVAGHVPGAINRPLPENLDAAGRFKRAERLRADWQPLLEAAGARTLVSMCGSGVTACHHVLALHHAGHAGIALYPGSWSDWISDAQRPVATGPTDSGE